MKDERTTHLALFSLRHKFSVFQKRCLTHAHEESEEECFLFSREKFSCCLSELVKCFYGN